MTRIILVLVALLFASKVASGTCYEPDHLNAFLRLEHGLKLYSWGLDDDGNMLEMMTGPTGHFAVVKTTPARPPAARMNEGEPM